LFPLLHACAHAFNTFIGCPWAITGDFNIDAIPNHHLTNAFGYSFDTAVKDSTEYLQMMAALSPGEPLTDLLKEKFHHKHPSTRPPRLQFPKSLEYILHHKYPQRLDYVLFSKGSLGELSASVDGTRIEKFEISEFMHQPEAREGDAGDSSGSVRDEGLSGEAPGSPGGFFSRWMNANSCRRPEKLPYQSLSDHYGLGISLRCEHTLEWEQRHRPEMGNVVARAATQIPHGGAATLLTAARNLFLACFLVLLLNWLDRFLHWSDWEMAVGPVRLQTDPLQLFPLPRDVVVAVRILLVCALFLNILREVVFEWDWWKRRFDTAKHLHGTFTKSAVIATTTRLPSEYGDDVGKRRDSQRPRSLSMDSKAHAHTLSSPEDSSRVLRSPLYPEELIKSYRTNIRTLADIFVETAERFGYRECAGFRPQLNDGSRGAYEWLSFDHIFRRVERFGAGLRNLFEDSDRLQRQTRIGILSENRVEWLICDQACFAHSFVSVPLLATGPTFLRKLLQHSGVALVVCGRRWTEQVIECKSTCPNLRGIVQMDRLEYDEMEAAEQADIPLYEFWYIFFITIPILPPQSAKSTDLNTTICICRYVETKGQRSLAVTPQLPNAHDVATIVYKVQLNNEPHGVVLTHENLVASVSGLDLSLEGMSEEDVHFSYAPLGHITERIMLLYALRKGMAIGFSQGIYSKIFEDLGVLKPTFLVGSPGIFENMFLKLERTMQSWNFAYRWLFRTAYARKLGLLAKNRRDGTRQNTSLVWDYFVFRRIARIMGGNLRYIVMTDGVLDTQVHDFVQTCFCCPVVYGLTLPEAGGLVSLTSLPYSDPSCLGFPLPCVELFIKPIPEFERVARTATATSNWCGLGALVGDARLGELCIRGPSTFQGYSTSQAHSSKDVSGVDTDKRTGGGWFGTGKVCHFNKDGTLTMVGELNDIIEVQYGVGAVGGLPSAWSPRVHHLVNLGRLEAIYSQVELVHQIWLCTYRSGVFPEEEEHNGSDGEGLREARGDDDGDDGDDDSEVEIDGDDREDNVRRAASRSSSSKIHRTRGKSEPSPNLDEQRMRRIHQLPLVAVVKHIHTHTKTYTHINIHAHTPAHTYTHTHIHHTGGGGPRANVPLVALSATGRV
jgi:long-chain acyl-CoA synthetase